MHCKNKRIVITGGTSGIGYELTRQLHAANELIVISRSTKKLKKSSREFAGIVTYQADLSNLAEVDKVAHTITKYFKSIDVLINNAAVQYTPTILDDDFSVESISHEITLNFTSICRLTYRLLPALLHDDLDDEAVILNVNSGLALSPKTSSAIYCATKSALNTFSQAIRYQLESSNIKVHQAFLELVDTNMTVGRGKNKMSAELAATKIIHGIECNIQEHDIGKVKLLRLLLRLAPSITQKIMKKY